jgi:hypothetical protein
MGAWYMREGQYRVFLVMNAHCQFFGKGGWVTEKEATPFMAEEAVQMLRIFSATSLIGVRAKFTVHPEDLAAVADPSKRRELVAA